MSGDGAHPADGPGALGQVDTGKTGLLFWVDRKTEGRELLKSSHNVVSVLTWSFSQSDPEGGALGNEGIPRDTGKPRASEWCTLICSGTEPLELG